MNIHDKTKELLIIKLHQLQQENSSLKTAYQQQLLGQRHHITYDIIVEKAADGFWLLDKEFKTVFANPALEELLGYTMEEMEGRSWCDFGDTEWVERGNKLEKRRTSGIKETHEFMFIHKDGRKILTRIATTPLYDKDGNFDGAIGVLSDITKQKEALLESEARFLAFMDNLPASAFIKDINGRYLFLNRFLIDLMGFNNWENKSISDLVTNVEANRISDDDKTAIEQGVFEFEETMKVANGNYRTFETIKFPVQVSENKLLLGGIAIDITERIKSEEALRERNKELKCLYAVTELCTIKDIKVDELFNETVKILSNAWLYSEIAVCCITYLGKEYKTENFKRTKWMQKAELNKLNDIGGIIEVCYLEKKPDIYEGPFLKEERNLINVVAKKLNDFMLRKESEQKIKESEEKYRLLVENTDTGFVVLDQTGKVISANEPYIKLAGFKIDKDIIGKSVMEWTAADELENNEIGVSNCVKQGFINDFETIYQHSNGTRLNILVNAIVYKTAEGADQIISYCRNITERKEAENLLKENELRFRAFIEQSPVAIGLFNLEGKGLYSNQKFLETMGLPNIDEMIGRPAHEYFVPQFREDSRERTRRRLQGLPVPQEFESVVLRSDGYEFPVKLAVAPIHLPSGIASEGASEAASLAFLFDLTEIKQNETALKESKDYLDKIINTVASPIFVKNEKHEFYLVNKALCSLLGSPEHKILGTTGYERFPKSQFDTFITKDQQVLSSGKENINEEVITDGQGKIRTIITHKTRYIDASGNKFLVGVITDITQRRQVEFNLEISQQNLRNFATHLQSIREEEKVDLAREIHDDLGQVLVALKIDLGLSKKKLLNRIENISSEDIQQNFDNLSNLVDRTIKTTRRIMTGLRPEIIETQGFIEASKLFVKDFEDRYKIACRFENTVTELNISKKKSIALFRILQEALSNIGKHAKANMVEIQLSTMDGKFIMEIIDNGVGFDQNNKIREDSYGLIGMKERIILLNGRLNVKSTVGKGTSIRVEILNVG